ncbi:autotransporter domain-containing protein [Hyphomonas sp.]|uniref:autotransporter outer membrane beta-barrel domain-containing protein n=1 Tax=Hyphomonas sp. TaxID=87 RepID=UPI00391AB22F
MNRRSILPIIGSRNRGFARSIAQVSRAALAASLLSSGIANADPAVFFNEDVNAGIQTFVNTIQAADANYNAANPGATRTSHVYAFDIQNTSGGSFLVLGTNGAPSVVVETTRGGAPAANSQNGDEGSDGFTNWSNSHGGTFADAEALGYTYSFFAADGVTPFEMNALGTMVNDWGTCCVSGNPTPDGNTSNASEVYLRFGASAPILLGGISSSIPGTEHFIGAINDANFFDTVSVIATGNGEYFGVGGYLTFSTVALNSVPAGSSVVNGNGLQPPTASIPDIDTASTYYTAVQLGASQVNPNFVGGTLRFNMDTFVGANFTAQTQGGAIDSETNFVTITGNFSGAGNIRKVGSGLLTLDGINTNLGGFTIEEGTLRASNQASLGGGPLTIGNAIFQAGASMTSAHEVIVEHAASRFDVQAHNVTWQGEISGQGALNVMGTGSLVLEGTNTYSGGTNVVGGTLQVSSDASLGGGTLTIGNAVFQAGADLSSARAMVVEDAASRFDVQSHDVTWLGDISGQGTLNVLGGGRLTLGGANSYAGGTFVDLGTLSGSAGSIQGDILNNGVVEFVQTNDGAYDGEMGGTGSLRKLGLGLLELTGISAIGGDSFVDEGGLSINGVLGTNLLTVANGAYLAGSGGVNGQVIVLSGGVLRPGNSPGTLFVSGDVTLNSGAIFETDIDGRTHSSAGGAGSHDLLVLTGAGATFTAAGSINPLLRGISGDANNDFDPVIGDVFTVVLADNIAGTFDSIDQPANGLPANTRFKVLYNQDSIQLALVARSLGVLAQGAGLRSNAAAAGFGLDVATGNGEQASGVLDTLLAGFDGLSQAQAGAALASLSGDYHAHILESTESILVGSDEMILSAALGGKGVGGIDRELKNGTRVWSRAEARGAKYDPDAAGAGFEEDTYGVTLGATFINKKDVRVGVAGSYKTVELYNNTANGATNHMLSAYGYASKAMTPRLTLTGLAGYTRASPKTTRTTTLANVVAHTKSDETVSIIHAQMEARYKLANTGETSVYALGGLRTAFLNVDAYRERGSAAYADLSLNGESRNTVQTKLGAEIARSVKGIDLAVFANWMRDIGDDPTVERTASLGSAIWQVQSVERSLDTYNYGLSGRREINDRVGIELEYTGRYNASNYDAQQLMVGVNVAW